MAHHNATVWAIEAIVERDLVYDDRTLPDPRAQRHLHRLLWHTLGRDARGRSDSAGASASEMQDPP